MYCISQGTDISGHQGEQLGNGDAMVWSQRERLLTLAATELEIRMPGQPSQRIGITWTPCRFGGERPWFQCGCGRNVVKFYSPLGGLFACRICSRLTYPSQLETPMDRGIGRARKIRVRTRRDCKPLR